TFSRPTFTSHKHRSKHTRDFPDNVIYAIHGPAVSQQSINPAATQHLLSSRQLARYCGAAASAVDRKPQLLYVEWLLQKIYGAIAKQLKGRPCMLAPSEGDDWWSGGKLRSRPQEIPLRLLLQS